MRHAPGCDVPTLNIQLPTAGQSVNLSCCAQRMLSETRSLYCFMNGWLSTQRETWPTMVAKCLPLSHTPQRMSPNSVGTCQQSLTLL
jgi:hypothetical protein